jgi:hypothetical protein
MEIDIIEYTAARSYLRGLVEEAARQERERQRIRGLLKTAKEAAEKAARQGQLYVRLYYGASDVEVMTPLLGRIFLGCTLTQEEDNIVTVSWT